MFFLGKPIPERNSMLLGLGVMINWNNVAPENRPAYDAWHCHEHMAGRVTIPGFLRGRRYIAAVPDQARGFLTMYEVETLEVLTSDAYFAKANNPSPLTQRTSPVVRDAVRGLSRVRASHGPAKGTMGGMALTLRFEPQPGAEDAVEKFLTQQALPQIAQREDIAGAHLMVADKAASAVVPVERHNRPTQIPNWIVMIEGFTLAAVHKAGAAVLPDSLLAANGCAGTIERDSYALQFTLLSPRLHA
jgi:hypothetical protein